MIGHMKTLGPLDLNMAFFRLATSKFIKIGQWGKHRASFMSGTAQCRLSPERNRIAPLIAD